MPRLPTSATASIRQGRDAQSDIGTGIEWMVEAFDCDVDCLRDLDRVRQVCDQVVEDLGLKVIGHPLTHQFDDPSGVTALYMLSESHLTSHTYPEYRLATFNLYCCRARPAWDWSTQLPRHLGAGMVRTRQFSRGLRSDDPQRLPLERLETTHTEGKS